MKRKLFVILVAIIMLLHCGMATAATTSSQSSEELRWRTTFKSDEITDRNELLMRAKNNIDDSHLSLIDQKTGHRVEFDFTVNYHSKKHCAIAVNSTMITTQLLEIKQSDSEIIESYATTFFLDAYVDEPGYSQGYDSIPGINMSISIYFTKRWDPGYYVRFDSSSSGYNATVPVGSLRILNGIVEDMYRDVPSEIFTLVSGNMPQIGSYYLGSPSAGRTFPDSKYVGFIKPGWAASVLYCTNTYSLLNGVVYSWTANATIF